MTATPPALAKIEPERSRAYYEKAAEHYENGDLRAAVIELKNALQRNPQNGEARLLLGEVYVRLGDGAAAEKELRAGRRHGISAERTIVHLGRALLMQRKFDDLLAEVEAADHEPALALEIHLLRADASAGLGRFSDARRGYEALTRRHPEEARAYLGLGRLDLEAREFEDAEAHARAALERDSGLAEASLVLAEARRLSGAAESALPFYRQVTDDARVAPGLKVRARLGLAAALVALQRDDEAETELQAVQSLAPQMPLAAYLRALIKIRAQDFEVARDILEGAGPVLESYAPAQFLFGVVYFAAEEHETARTWLSRHLRIHPQNLQARKLLATALLRLNTVADAVEVLEVGLAQAPEDPQVLMLLGNAYVRSGRSAEATELFQRAAERAPQDPRVLNQLAISHMAIGEYGDSLAALTASLNLDSSASTLGYALAFVHLKAGSFDEALKVAQELRARFPESAVAANLEGGAYAALGELEQARASFEAVLAIDPAFHEARANIAALKAQAGDIDGAEAEYRTILESDAGNGKALMGLAAVASRQGDTAASRDWLKKAVEANPEAPKPSLALAESYAAAGEQNAAVAVLTALARRQPENLQVLSALGNLQGQAGRMDEAIKTFERLVAASDGSVEARRLLARARLAAGDASGARDELEAALAANPDHLPTVEALFQLLPELEGPEAAIAYAERLRRRYPEALWGPLLIGDLHLRAGRWEKAVAAYESGWAKQPTARLAIALSRARLGQGEKQEALAPLQQWLAQQPDDDRVRLVLAERLLDLGDQAEARREYEILKESQADNPVVWNNLAWLYQEAGDARAVDHGERALALAPDQPAVMDTLGWILLDAGEVRRAAGLLHQARLAAPENPDIAYHYAVALHRQGDSAGARKVLKDLLASDGRFASREDAAALLRELSP